MEGSVVRDHKFYGEEETAALIRALDRDEDHHIFAEDVVKTYPYLAESYTKVCPRRCDLATAAQKALEGAYSYDVKLTDLRADIALMVSNCVAYNGPTSAYAETAAKFERFALDQIDLFIVEHNGGRRLSRLRLPAATAPLQPPPTPGAPTKKTSASDKREASSTEKTAAAAASATVTAFVVPTTREVVQLVDSLNRREDGGAFSVDVAEAYPDLRASYQKMCPHPMNLLLMHQRAKEGFYTASSSSAAPLFGTSVAASFTRLREDVELLVRNCITFNAKVDSWVTLARGFHAFAHRRIDDFVLRHAASLRGTQTGAQVYLSATSGPDPATTPAAAVAASTSAAEVAAAAVPISTAARTSSSGGRHEARKRERAEERLSNNSHSISTTTAAASTSLATAPSPVKVVGEVVPQVCPTPLQPGLVIPPRLRRRLALEHLHHAQLPLRRVGVSVPLAALYPALPKSETKPDETDQADAPSAEVGEEHKEPSEEDTTLPASSSSSARCVSIDTSCSAAHVVQMLERSIDDFFSEQRRRPDFADTFAFSQREERLYRDVLRVIAELFEHTAPHLLLYERESAELAEWTALRALQSADVDVAGRAAPRLADHLHYLYLVRFLVQWPQLACLCCTSSTAPARSGSAVANGAGTRSSGAATTTAAQGSLRISRDQLKAMAQVALITQEFLNFIEKVEEKVSGGF
ncbi:hypothetical protein ABB37_07022 [Leptomonas pyrrhocoris]|uniref:Bromo domain-containing protein n=1 Tax=Leptomonas pyrrhocoris TaxID=157538 RepID=A0A0M9FX05_LEPPY|nr:hypothetical protein ABB37_07022 [Leptomonas pyrrhocoris]KPA77689.1 hypothetical protein ABB37_07022 [Leptomonas pyrrhocoris]|eukprot:XP_015656128.1 hypothetical protein ABB37_07022 [Leptomonas pyrrhocoris]